MAKWYTVSISRQGGTCDYSTLYYYQYSSSSISGDDGWYASQTVSISNRVGSIGQRKDGCEFLGGYANANGTGTQYFPASGNLINSSILPSHLPASSSFTVYLCWAGSPSASLSKTNLSGGPSSIIYEAATGHLYDDASMTTPLPTTTIQEGGQTVAAWGPITLPAKECYAFRGFYSATNNTGTLYIDENGYVRQSLVDALAVMSANDSLTIYAKGEETSRKLTLNANGGTGGWSAIYNSLVDRSKWYADSLCEGDPITSVPVPGKITSANAGYVFNGYKYSSTVYIDQDGSLNSNLTSLTNFTNRTATANWLSTTKMTVNANGGTGGDAFFYWCSSRSAYFHAVDGALTQTATIVPPTYPGYAFTGLYTAATGGTQKVAADGTISSGLTSATTLYAQWTKTAYTVTFSGSPDTLPTLYVKASGGGLYRDADCEEAVESGELLWESPPVKDGYTFLGVFASDSSSSTQYATSTGAAMADFVALTATGDVTVYCVFDVLQEVSFDDAGGTGGPASLWYLDHQLYSDSIGETVATWPISPLPSRECFAFLGYFDGTGDTQYVDQTGAMTQELSDLVTAGITEPLELYAQWDRRTYRVVLDSYGTVYSLAGGEVGWTSDADGTTAIASVPVPVRAGYEFLGYFTAGSVQVVNSSGAVMEFVGGDGDVSLVAHWNARQYTLGFVGASIESKTVTFGSAIGTLPTVSITPPTGAVFSSWSIDGLPVSATTPWTWPEDKTARISWEYDFGDVVDYFGMASDALIPFESSDGSNNPRIVTRHYGKAQGADQSGPKWLNPTVKYMVVGDMNLAVTLGKAFAAKTGTIYGPYKNNSGQWVFGNHNGMTETGYMMTSVTVETALDSFPVVTVSATANEGANAINQFSVSVSILARARAQNLFGAIFGGGELHALTLAATCDPVILQEGLAPCASDAVNGRLEVHAETVPLDFESAPAPGTGFSLTGVTVTKSGTDFTRYQISVMKEVF